jgi:hypothetical protein
MNIILKTELTDSLNELIENTDSKSIQLLTLNTIVCIGETVYISGMP